MTNFENVDYSLYKNFVSEGLTFIETINPSYVVPEPIVAPTVEPDPFLNADKDLKLMNYFNELWEMNTENYTATETWRLMEAYYNRNSDYFTPLDRFGVKEKLAYKYIYNAKHPTIRPTRADKYLFFMKIFDGFSGDNSDDYNRRQAEASRKQKFLDLLDKLYQLDENERYNRRTAQYINTATYYDENREYLNGIDIFTIIDNTITDDKQSNFYKQIFQDLKSNQYARETLQQETTEQTGGYVDYEAGTNVEDSQTTFTEDKPGTIYSESFM